MPKFANYFATVSEDGRITLLTDASPAQELQENQIMLTPKEYALLRVVHTMDEAKKLMEGIEKKIGELNDTSIQP